MSQVTVGDIVKRLDNGTTGLVVRIVDGFEFGFGLFFVVVIDGEEKVLEPSVISRVDEDG